MVNKNNLITQIENKKPFEIVQEVNNKMPSFEEFMKTYENDGNLNYDDLSDGSIGEVKGYGPCSDGRNGRNCPCSRDELQKQYGVAINNSNITIQTNITNIGINCGPGSVPQISQPFYFEIFISSGSGAEYRGITRIKDGGVGGDSYRGERATFRNEGVAYRMIIRDIENARRTLRALECGGISVRGGQFGGAAYESTSQDLVARATRKLRDAIARGERGETINEDIKLYP